MQNVDLEVDSLTVVTAVNSSYVDFSPFGLIISDYIFLLNEILNVKISFV